MGDPVGIGPEITAATLAEISGDPHHHGIAVGDAAALRRGARAANVDVDLRPVSTFDVEPAPRGAIQIFDTGVLGEDIPAWGEVDERAGRAAVRAIEVATAAAMRGDVAGIVTGPINKEAIWKSGAQHLGHTEMLGALTGATRQDTMFEVRGPASERPLRIFFATRHLSLRQAIDRLTRSHVRRAIDSALTALRVFGSPNPHLAVAALNPHGGENGAFGQEEIEHIIPACEDAREAGAHVTGPVPADSIFHQGLQGRFDGILSLFHDQGHIAAKTFDFSGTVSVTVGLPILRTSVDHGTAFDIAGAGVASPDTMRAAYKAARELALYVPAVRSEWATERSAAQQVDAQSRWSGRRHDG